MTVMMAVACLELAPMITAEGAPLVGEPSSALESALPEVSGSLQEWVVTAQKRAERLEDVPLPVTAIDARSLVDAHQLKLQDYYTSIPGLSMASGIHGEPYLAIRGLTAGYYGNPGVGITIDDVPYGSSTALGGGYMSPDIDPSDLARIEVLRGPQGTLYGANSLGGLIKYVTVDPSTDTLSGRLQLGSAGVRNGDRAGYSARGSINVPMGDTWALGLSGYTRGEPGYIDNIRDAEHGVNNERAQGGRASLLWRPSAAMSLKLNALLQDSRTDGLSESFLGPGFGDQQQDVLRGSGRYDELSQHYSAILTYQLGAAGLTSLTGYNIHRTAGWSDVTAIYGAYSQARYGLASASSEDFRKTSKLTQEVRLAMPLGSRLEWLLGAFYTHEQSDFQQAYFSAERESGALGPEFVHGSFPTRYSEYAAFTDLTLKISARLDVQLGGRETHIEQALSQTLIGPLVGGTSVGQGESRGHAFTYLATPRLKLSADLMLYARLTSGYRPGGPNVNAALLGVPRQYNPDETRNYEIGVKGDALHHALSFDLSAYSIDWKDIQTNVTRNGFGYYANAGAARSQGLELSIESRPLDGLTLTAWAAWGEATLTDAFPATSTVYGDSGDRLPGSTRFSGNLSLQQNIRITGGVTAFLGGSLSYVGNRLGLFQATPVRQIFPAYARTDLRTGVSYRSWSATAFVTNLTDRRGMLAGGLDAVPATSYIFIRPRTFGLSLSKVFGQ